MTTPLEPSVVVETLRKAVSLQTTPLQSPNDAIAAVVHAIMLSIGCTFIGLGDDARQATPNPLPQEWNSQGPNSYSFCYHDPQSSKTLVIKCIKLVSRCVIHGLAIGDDKTATLDIGVDDLMSANSFPYDHQHDDSLIGFRSADKLDGLISQFKDNIIQRLIPGFNTPTEGKTTSWTHTHPQRSHPSPPPVASHTNPLINSRPFSDVGRSDLDPLAGSHMPGVGDSGGMLVGPGHAMFSDQNDDPLTGSFFGGPQALPRGAVPPGARFDPIGPFGRMPPGRGPGGRGSGSMGRFSGDPDNDELAPPGYDNMFM